MTVEFQEMRWALTVSQHRSLRSAAETLHVRQSTLSRRLRDLEARLGTQLFERTNGGTRPTTAGIEFLEHARRILDDTEATLRNLKTRSLGENGRLTIGGYASFATGNLHATLADYRQRFPEVDVHTIDGSHSRLICALARSAVDIAIMTGHGCSWDDRALALWTERVVVAMPDRHPLCQQSSISWSQLAPESLILPLHGPGPELEALLSVKLNGDRPARLLHQEAGLDRLLSLVSAEYGILLMLEGGTGLRHEGVVYREVRDSTEPTRLGFMAHWRESNRSPTLQRFLGILQERYPDLSGPPVA